MVGSLGYGLLPPVNPAQSVAVVHAVICIQLRRERHRLDIMGTMVGCCVDVL